MPAPRPRHARATPAPRPRHARAKPVMVMVMVMAAKSYGASHGAQTGAQVMDCARLSRAFSQRQTPTQTSTVYARKLGKLHITARSTRQHRCLCFYHCP
eukprot:gene12101-biopygen6423